MITEVIILAGGFGTRLRSVVNDVPKPMAPINNKPFLDIIIRYYIKKGIKRFILSLGYKAEIVIEYFEKKYDDIEIVFVKEELPLGTGGAIRLALSELKTNHALVINGDSFLEIDFDIIRSINENGITNIIFGISVDDGSRYGCIEHKNGIIVSLKEKNERGSSIINGGVYVLNKNILDSYPINQSFSLEKDFFSKITENDNFKLIVSTGYFIDIGVPEDYLRAQTELQQYI